MALNKYMNGYLSILPAEEREAVLKHIREEQPEVFKNVTYEQFKALVTQIASFRALITEFQSQAEILDSDTHNSFFSSVYSDLMIMFNELQLIERSINNYQSVASSEISQLEYEIQLLKATIQDTQAILDNNDFSMSFSCLIGSSDPKEELTEETKSLFVDRDGSGIPDCMIEKNKAELAFHNQSYSPSNFANLSFKPTLIKDVTKGEDLRGHELLKIIDNNTNTSWIHAIENASKIGQKLYGYTDLGALCHIQIDFGSSIAVNTLGFELEGVNAADIAYIAYGKNYIYANKKFIEDTKVKPKLEARDYDPTKHSLTFNFPTIRTQKIDVLFRQPNYKIETVTPPPPKPPKKKEWITYKVKKGDCLWHIAHEKFKGQVTWQSIAKLNNIKGPHYYIYAGQVLKIMEKK